MIWKSPTKLLVSYFISTICKTFILDCFKNDKTRSHGGIVNFKSNQRVESGRKATSLLIVRLIIAIVHLDEQLRKNSKQYDKPTNPYIDPARMEVFFFIEYMFNICIQFVTMSNCKRINKCLNVIVNLLVTSNYTQLTCIKLGRLNIKDIIGKKLLSIYWKGKPGNRKCINYIKYIFIGIY